MKGAILDGMHTNIGSYYFDFILKYRGFAFVADYMGRHTPGTSQPIIDGNGEFVYTGCGLNVQTSYLFDGKWEVALRNSTMFPTAEAQPYVNYSRFNPEHPRRHPLHHRPQPQSAARHCHTTTGAKSLPASTTTAGCSASR